MDFTIPVDHRLKIKETKELKIENDAPRKNNNTTWGNKPESSGERREIKEILTKGKTIQTKQDIPKQRKKSLPTTNIATWRRSVDLSLLQNFREHYASYFRERILVDVYNTCSYCQILVSCTIHNGSFSCLVFFTLFDPFTYSVTDRFVFMIT